jgi:hypothetical protein
VIRHTQNFFELHHVILQAFEFDNKHQSTFFRSNDQWLRGREISIEKYPESTYKVEPLIMSEVALANEIKDPNQKFVYLYDFNKAWTFKVELIGVDKEENKKLTYPTCIRKEGLAPSQYGTKGMIDSRLAEIEEKYDLQPSAMMDGFSEEDEDGNATGADNDSSEGGEESGAEDF